MGQSFFYHKVYYYNWRPFLEGQMVSRSAYRSSYVGFEPGTCSRTSKYLSNMSTSPVAIKLTNCVLMISGAIS